MKRQAMCALVVFVLMAMVGRASAVVIASSSFQDGLGEWARGADAEGVAGFLSGATVSTSPAHEDRSSVVLNAEGNGPGGAVWLESGVSVEPGTYHVRVAFWVYSCNDADGAASEAIAALKADPLSGAGGFTLVRRIDPGLGWQHLRMTKTISIERGQMLHVGVGFRRADAATVKYAFDDLSVDVDRADCRADVDGSGSLTVADVLAFIDAWFSGAPAGDFDGSGRIEPLDIFAFLNAWLAGCGA